LEVQQIKVRFSNSAAGSTDNGMNCTARLFQQICQPVLHIALEHSGIYYYYFYHYHHY